MGEGDEEPDLEHLGVRAFARLASPEGGMFRWDWTASRAPVVWARARR